MAFKMTRLNRSARALCGLSLLLAIGCGGRPDSFDESFDAAKRPNPDPTDPSGTLQVRGLTGSVALLDPNLHQVMLFTSEKPLELGVRREAVGRDVVQFKSSFDRDKLFVLSRGVTPRYKESDEKPQLRIFDGGSDPKQIQTVELQDPYSELEVDPMGEWLLIHGSSGLVSNPNELLLVHLEQDGSGATLMPKTLDSKGGKPLRFTFTSELTVPGAGKRRLLVVQREKDLAIVDLAAPEDPEITVSLGEGAEPLDVVFHDGIEDEVNSMLAVQLKGDSNVDLLTINAAVSADRHLSVHPNLVPVGGVPSKLDFVQTRKNGGLRLAALVPSKQVAKLVDPASGSSQEVPFSTPFSKLRRITNEVSEGSGEDVALLYGDATNTIAFWRLGITTGTPYHSIEAYELGIKVGNVFDIPSQQHDEFADHKILSGSASGTSQQFYVLDLTAQKSFPLDALTNLTLNLSTNGRQLWAFGSSKGFARLTFDPLQPASLYTEQPIVFVHDFATARDPDERSLMALHLLTNGTHQTVAATMFDGDNPDTARTRFFSELELEGLK
jgi:hypothetical protein